MMIFVHGIIPHNHIDSDAFECTGYVHDHHQNGQSPEYRELCRDFESCGISNLLFQKVSSDDSQLLPENNTSPDPYIESETYFISHNHEIASGIHPYSVLLRAPPIA